MRPPKSLGTMNVSITPLDGRHAGKYHVQLDWRAGEIGYFTPDEMVRLALALLRVADPAGIGEIGEGSARELVYNIDRASCIFNLQD